MTISVVEIPTTVTINGTDTTQVLMIDVGIAGPQGATGLTGAYTFAPVYSYAGDLTLRTGTQRLYIEQAGTINKFRAALGTAPVGQGVIVRLNLNGSPISTLTVTGNTAVNTLAVTVAPNDYLTLDITQIGTTNPGADLTATVTIN